MEGKETADKYQVLINNYIISAFSLSSLKGVPYLPSWPLTHQAKEVGRGMCSPVHHFRFLLGLKSLWESFFSVFIQRAKRGERCDLAQSVTE